MPTDAILHPDDLPDEQLAKLRESLEELGFEGPVVSEGELHVGEEGKISLPGAVVSLLTRALDELSEGHSVSLMASHDTLTTSEAAQILDVSRPHLVDLLDDGEIPFFRVGSHRRIRHKDLLAYQRKREAKAEKAYQDLVRQAQELEMGYDETADEK